MYITYVYLHMYKLFAFSFMLLITACNRRQQEPLPVQKNVDPINSKVNKHAYYKHTELSQQFNMSVNFNVYTNVEGEDSSVVQVVVTSKRDEKTIDSILLTTTHYCNMHFSSDTNVRSYTTYVNKDREIIDDYYGDIIVADFNFDGLDDITILREPSNAMDRYAFYIQSKEGKFKPNTFLNDSVQCFPSLFDADKKQLTTYIRVGCCNISEHIYQLQRNKWREISQELLEVE